MPNRPKRPSRPQAGQYPKMSGVGRTGGGLLGYLTGANKLKAVEDPEGGVQYAARRPFLDALFNRGNAAAAAMNYNITNQQNVLSNRLAADKAIELAQLQAMLRERENVAEAQRKALAEKAMVDYRNQKELEMLPKKEAITTQALTEREQQRLNAEKAIKDAQLQQEYKDMGNAAMLARNPNLLNSYIIDPAQLGQFVKYGQKVGEAGKGQQEAIMSGQISNALLNNQNAVGDQFIQDLLAKASAAKLASQKANDEMTFRTQNPSLVQNGLAGETINKAGIQAGQLIPGELLAGKNLLSVNNSTVFDRPLPMDPVNNPFGTRTERVVSPASISPANFSGTTEQARGTKLSPQDILAAQGAPQGSPQKTAPTTMASDQVELQELLRRINVLRNNLPSATNY